MTFIITYSIIALTLLVSIPAFSNTTFRNRYLFNAYMIRHRREWYRLFTHALLHADWIHLLINMYIFYLFGRQVEIYYAYFFEGMGKLFYFLLYLGGVVMSSLYAYERNKDNIHYNALGASGAVSSVLFASIVMDPSRMIGFFFIPMPGWMAGIVYLLYSWYMNRRAADNVAHDAHFWGAVFGVVFTIILRPAFAVEFIGKIIP